MAIPNDKKNKSPIKTTLKKVASSVGLKNKKVIKSKKIIKDVKLSKNKKVLTHKTVTLKSKANLKNKKLSLSKKKQKIEKKIERKEESNKKDGLLRLKKVSHNPIISPSLYSWESEGSFNPTAIISGGKVHLFYRALGSDGISRIGYASSDDGINFNTRLTYPIYTAQNYEEAKKHWPYTSPARLVYDPDLYSSGGSWGGCEDPRAVIIDGYVYMTFNVFNGWNSMRVAVISIKEKNLINKRWIWENFSYLSRFGDRQKNWVLFPEKINGKFAIFCNLDRGDPNKVFISYVNNLDSSETPSSEEALDPQLIPDHEVAWHYRTRSAACPPIKTKDGWLLLYHAMDKNEPNKYKVGALLLDLNNPEKVLYRSNHPILEPEKWYENDYKPGIVYANGAIVKNGTLFVYYGGGDKYVCVAYIKLQDLINSIKEDKIIKLKNLKNIENI